MASRVLMTGNDAIGEGAIHAGCDSYFGYPITPQNELTAYMAKHMLDKNRIFIQAESELAAINMVFGAAAAGKRAMTSSSSPGISLKQEGISYIAASHMPAVIVNIQRGGPGLGNIAPSQADYFQATKGGGHGDYHMIVLAPYSVQEMHDLTVLAFELADKYCTPVMVLADGQLGQMMEPLYLREEDPPPVPPKPWAITGCKGREPQIVKSLFLPEGELEANNIKLQKKYETIKNQEIRFEEHMTDDCELLIAAFGTSARISENVVNKARSRGIKAGLLRPITLWPFPYSRISEIAQTARNVLVVEMSAGQFVEDVQLAVSGKIPVFLEGRMGGTIPTESDIMEKINKICNSNG